jgi:hypothetical protein
MSCFPDCEWPGTGHGKNRAARNFPARNDQLVAKILQKVQVRRFCCDLEPRAMSLQLILRVASVGWYDDSTRVEN